MAISSMESERSNPQPKLCFILGIQQRSGTNYLYRLLGQHPDCYAQGPIMEDFLIHHVDLLKDYAHRVYGMWNPKWGVAQKIGPPEILLQHFGHALRQFLHQQLTTAKTESESASASVTSASQPQVLLTKSPSVRGLHHFFKVFPDDYLIVIVRDGRSVVESGVRSFDWDYEAAMRNWAASARAILNFQKKYANSDRKLLILRYEDIYQDEAIALRQIFDFLGLDPDRYNFDELQLFEVIGSSDLRRREGAVHWQGSTKQQDFNPLNRFQHWSPYRHSRFNWIAGQPMKQLGYELAPLKQPQILFRVINLWGDCWEKLKKIPRKMRWPKSA